MSAPITGFGPGPGPLTGPGLLPPDSSTFGWEGSEPSLSAKGSPPGGFFPESFPPAVGPESTESCGNDVFLFWQFEI